MICENIEYNPDVLTSGFGLSNCEGGAFDKKYEKAKRTLLRLMSKGETHKIRAIARHRGYGNYEFCIRNAYVYDIDNCCFDFGGKSTISDGNTIVPTYLYHQYYKQFFEAKIEYSGEMYKLYVRNPYHAMELYAEGDDAKIAAKEDARRFAYKEINILEVMAWQEFNEYVTTFYKRCFEKEIIDWQIKQINKAREDRGSFIHPSVVKKINSLTKQGKYSEAKRLMRIVVDYKFAKNISGGFNSENSLRQLRALGFVA